MENLSQHIIWTSLSQEWRAYIQEEVGVVCESEDEREGKAFDALGSADILNGKI